MYPNQQPPYQPQPPQQSPQPQAPLPTDYLNQIAPQQPPKKSNKIMKLLLILGAAALVILLLVAVVNVFASSRREPMEQLAARMQSTPEIVDIGRENLKSSQLRSTNSSLRVYFTNANRDIAEPFASVDINPAALSASVMREETAAANAMKERLEDARLNAIFDRTYAREMAYQLETLLVLMRQTYQNTGSESLRTYLSDAFDNLEPIQETFAEYNETND